MNESSGWLAAGLFLVAGLCMGSGLWLRWAAREKRRIPRHWPLHARVLLSSEELRVWLWLAETFDDHHVMIKMPVTRFTRPNPSENGLYWYDLLKNTTCTFSVCATDGHVVGCIDVPKSFGLSQKAKALKENLLAQCGISYLVLNPAKLPNPLEIRNEFLGEAAARVRHLKREEAAVAAARVNLQKTLVQQRDMRKDRALRKERDATSSMPIEWHDSFLIQSNSLPAELRTADGSRMA
jgi:hypothetical protein